MHRMSLHVQRMQIRHLRLLLAPQQSTAAGILYQEPPKVLIRVPRSAAVGPGRPGRENRSCLGEKPESLRKSQEFSDTVQFPEAVRKTASDFKAILGSLCPKPGQPKGTELENPDTLNP